MEDTDKKDAITDLSDADRRTMLEEILSALREGDAYGSSVDIVNAVTRTFTSRGFDVGFDDPDCEEGESLDVLDQDAVDDEQDNVDDL